MILTNKSCYLLVKLKIDLLNFLGDDTARLLASCDNHDPDQKLVGQGRLAPGGQLVSCRCGCGCSVASNTHYGTVQSAGDSPTPNLQSPTCRPAPVSHNVHFSCCYTTRQKQALQGKAVNESVGKQLSLDWQIDEVKVYTFKEYLTVSGQDNDKFNIKMNISKSSFMYSYKDRSRAAREQVLGGPSSLKEVLLRKRF